MSRMTRRDHQVRTLAAGEIKREWLPVEEIHVNFQTRGIENAQLSIDSARHHDLQRLTSKSNVKLSRSTMTILSMISLNFKLN